MYLAVSSLKLEDGKYVYLVVGFRPNVISIKTMNEDEMIKLYSYCRSEKEATNIKVGLDGQIGIMLGSKKKGVVPIVNKVSDTNSFCQISVNCLWSILSNAITEDALLVTDKGNEEINKIEFCSATRALSINGNSYSYLDNNEFTIRYPSEIVVNSLYDRSGNNFCEIDGKNVTFNLKHVDINSRLKGIIKFISPPLESVIDSMIKEYKDMLGGYLLAHTLMSGRVSKEFRTEFRDLMELLPKDVDVIRQNEVINSAMGLDIDVTNRDRDSVRRGVEEYRKYGEKSMIGANPTDDFMYRCIKKEHNLLNVYRYYLEV